jgi:hypothetical protein
MKPEVVEVCQNVTRRNSELRRTWPYSLWFFLTDMLPFALAVGWLVYSPQLFGVPPGAAILGFWVPILLFTAYRVYQFVRQVREELREQGEWFNDDAIARWSSS